MHTYRELEDRDGVYYVVMRKEDGSEWVIDANGAPVVSVKDDNPVWSEAMYPPKGYRGYSPAARVRNRLNTAAELRELWMIAMLMEEALDKMPCPWCPHTDQTGSEFQHRDDCPMARIERLQLWSMSRMPDT